MPQINILNKEISELIAAGEVIERPASVIKELVENAIDAGARHITIEIKHGGITFMRIADDGCGIAECDVPKAFLRHATSKITEKDDLDNILTLGFRGEALASICAVSRVELLTKQREDEYGTRCTIDGGGEPIVEKTGCPDGTTIIIRDLFYNVPARQKFLKRDVTEGNCICSIVDKIALSHPEIAFKLIRDNKLEFNTSGDGELYSAVYAVMGKPVAQDMIKVDYILNGIRTWGYIIKPLYAKANRSLQNFFVNQRYIKSVSCRVALEEAYKGTIMTGKFPICVLMLDLPPAIVDVNVHPAKTEVRFSDEKIIFNSIYFAVKNALMQAGLIYDFQLKKPNIDYSMPQEQPQYEQKPLPSEKKHVEQNVYEPLKTFEPSNNSDFGLELNSPIIPPAVQATESVIEYSQTKPVEPVAACVPESKPVEGFKYISSSSFDAPRRAYNKSTEIEYDEDDEDEEEQPPEKKIRVIGEAFLNYILAEADEDVIIIDKHAAHERVIYERLKSENKEPDSQYTLCASGILVSPEEFDCLENNTELLGRMGFRLDFLKKPYVVPLAVPSYLKDMNMDEIVPEVAKNIYLNKLNPQSSVLDDLFHSLACKAAIKANDKNSTMELQALAELVYGNPDIRHCPHGRPVMFTISKKDFEKQFKRT